MCMNLGSETSRGELFVPGSKDRPRPRHSDQQATRSEKNIIYICKRHIKYSLTSYTYKYIYVYIVYMS